jgi:hypothetical protein
MLGVALTTPNSSLNSSNSAAQPSKSREYQAAPWSRLEFGEPKRPDHLWLCKGVGLLLLSIKDL